MALDSEGGTFGDGSASDDLFVWLLLPFSSLPRPSVAPCGSLVFSMSDDWDGPWRRLLLPADVDGEELWRRESCDDRAVALPRCTEDDDSDLTVGLVAMAAARVLLPPLSQTSNEKRTELEFLGGR